MAKPTNITIDGPSASGKTAVGRCLSRILGYRFMDTGLFYRALTWLALNREISADDPLSLTRLAEHACITIQEAGTERVVVDGYDVTDYLKRQDVDRTVSEISQIKGVRQALLGQQRAFAKGQKAIIAGRDIGTVVVPHADLKVFLVASPEARAQRRYQELLSHRETISYQQVLENLALRDQMDSGRDIAPLKPAADAHLIPTDPLSVDQVVKHILELI